MLPKFLFADNSQQSPDSIYVVHTQAPRCVIESIIDDDFQENNSIHWLDEKPENEKEIEELVALAEQFLDDELQNQEDLYDNDVEEE